MPSYFPPKKGVEYIFYISLAAQSQANTFQSNPTIASGDFKVSIDGGALANLATLPAVTPASSKMVKVTLSTSEMNGDNITFVGSDASGAEWRDIVVNIQTAARQLDDLAYPTTTGRSIDVTATGAVGVDWGNVENPTTTLGLSGTTIKTATDVETDTDAILADTNELQTDWVNGGRLDLLVDAVKAKTDNLPASPAATGDIPTAAAIADAVLDDPITEPAGVFTWSGSLRTIIGWLGALGRNKILQTSSLSTLRNDADNADVAESVVSDDGTTFTRGEWS